jgi:type IV pilus assembly protein PilC
MPTFTYRGVRADGGRVTADITAADERTAARQLRSQGIAVQAIGPARGTGERRGFDLANLPGVGWLFGAVRSKDVAVFSRQFATMIAAGLPLVQCLRALALEAERERLRHVINRVAEDVEAGITLSEAMGRHPRVFDNMYVSLVHVGEIGGVLDTILTRLSTYLEKSVALRRKVKMALIYPSVVVMVAVLVVTFILAFVIPVFAGVYEKAKVPLPALTRMVIFMSDILRGYFLIVLAVLVGMIFAVRAYYRTESGRLTIDRLMLKLPVFGLLIRKIAVTRFARTLSLLVGAGVPILDALQITARTAGNRVVENAIMAARTSITAGQTVSAPLRESGVFPAMVVQMISVGEQTGALETMLGKVADYYDEEVDATVAGLTSLLEPVLIVVLGVVVGGIVVAMYLPIFKLVTVIK